MKLLTVFTLSSALFLGGCNAAMWGNLAVLALTVGIFFSTLGLGRSSSATSTSGSTSTAGRR